MLFPRSAYQLAPEKLPYLNGPPALFFVLVFGGAMIDNVLYRT